MHFNIDFKDSSDIIFKLIKNILKILFMLKWNTYYRCTTYQVTSVISDSLCPCGLGFQTPLSMGFSRQECWSGLPCPPPGIFPTRGLNSGILCLLHCRQILYS